MRPKNIFILIIVFLLTSCGGNGAAPTSTTPNITLEPTNPAVDPLSTPTPLPDYYPKPGDNELSRAKVIPESVDLLSTETIPQEVTVLIKGFLPTPCHVLRANIAKPDTENNIYIELYSLTDPEVVCAQVLRAFNEEINLGSYPEGSYWIWVNEEKIGNFDSYGDGEN